MLPSSRCPPHTPPEWTVTQDWGHPFPDVSRFFYVVFFTIFVFFFDFSNQSFLHVLVTYSPPHFFDGQEDICLSWLDLKISMDQFGCPFCLRLLPRRLGSGEFPAWGSKQVWTQQPLLASNSMTHLVAGQRNHSTYMFVLLVNSHGHIYVHKNKPVFKKEVLWCSLFPGSSESHLSKTAYQFWLKPQSITLCHTCLTPLERSSWVWVQRWGIRYCSGLQQWPPWNLMTNRWQASKALRLWVSKKLLSRVDRFEYWVSRTWEYLWL